VSKFFEALPSGIIPILQMVLNLDQEARILPHIDLGVPKHISPEIAQNVRSECCMWQSQNRCGFLQLFFDPSSGERTGVVFNDLQARLLGMCCDELRTRFELQDVPLPFALQDLLLLLTDDIANGHNEGERFVRCIAGPSKLPVLVCISIRRSYNHAAQLIAVQCDPEAKEKRAAAGSAVELTSLLTEKKKIRTVNAETFRTVNARGHRVAAGGDFLES
jgi:hypothetical protein